MIHNVHDTNCVFGLLSFSVLFYVTYRSVAARLERLLINQRLKLATGFELLEWKLDFAFSGFDFHLHLFRKMENFEINDYFGWKKYLETKLRNFIELLFEFMVFTTTVLHRLDAPARIWVADVFLEIFIRFWWKSAKIPPAAASKRWKTVEKPKMRFIWIFF